MLKYAAKRFLLVIPTLISVAVLVFFLVRVVPGDVIEVKLQGEFGDVTPEQVYK
jgi:peptide/nickel transport system permease protein